MLVFVENFVDICDKIGFRFTVVSAFFLPISAKCLLTFNALNSHGWKLLLTSLGFLTSSCCCSLFSVPQKHFHSFRILHKFYITPFHFLGFISCLATKMLFVKQQEMRCQRNLFGTAP